MRITANPLAVADDNGNVLDEDRDEPAPAVASRSVSCEARDDMEPDDSQKRAGCVKTTAVVERACGPGSVAWSTMSREEQLRELEEAVAAGGSVTSWNYEDFGMTYGELMEYFDNLKESSA